MIKLFDFLYYYVYQLNRKGYKKNNHEYSRGFLAMIISILSAISTFFLGTILQQISSLDPLLFLFIFSALTYILTYYFLGKLYGKKGTRKHIVGAYDNKYSLRRQNRYIQVLLIWTAVILWWIFCILIDSMIKKAII